MENPFPRLVCQRCPGLSAAGAQGPESPWLGEEMGETDKELFVSPTLLRLRRVLCL